jgi:spore maturation protein B
LAATAVAHAAAIGACKLLEKSPWYRLRPIEETAASSATTNDESAAALKGREVEEEAIQANASLPWVPHAGRILAVVGGIFLAFLLATAFPEIIGQSPAPGAATHFFLRRIIDAISLLAIPWLIVFFPLYAALRRIPVYDEFVEGGKEGFNVSLRILPNIVAILVAVGMFRAAGGMEIVTLWLRPVTDFLHFPPELVPLALIRPFSGGASLGVLSDLMTHFPIDSLLVLTAGTLYGCSETTFYVIAVYFGSVGIRKTRHAIPAGLVADVIGPVASVIICRAVFS